MKRITLKVTCLSLLCFLLFCPAALAHQDRIVTLNNETLTALPEQYQPAFLSLKEKWIQIGGNRLDFPACVSKYFSPEETASVAITASWYHDLSILPPYLNIRISPKEKDFRYALLFNLDTLQPIKFTMEVRESERSTAFHEMAISDECKEEINSALRPVKPAME